MTCSAVDEHTMESKAPRTDASGLPSTVMHFAVTAVRRQTTGGTGGCECDSTGDMIMMSSPMSFVDVHGGHPRRAVSTI